MKLSPSQHMALILEAVELQARDNALWNPQTIHEAYITQALRDLHRVIELADEAALANIKDCMECTQ